MNENPSLNTAMILQSNSNEAAICMDVDFQEGPTSESRMNNDKRFHSPPSCRLRKKKRVNYKASDHGERPRRKKGKQVD